MKLLKYILSAISLILGITSCILIVQFDFFDTSVIQAFFKSSFSFFLFALITTYRISLINRYKVKLTSLLLFLVLLTLIVLMYTDKLLIYKLWDYALIGFVLLIGDALFQIIPKKKRLTIPAQVLTGFTLFMIVVLIAFKIKDPAIYYWTEIIMLVNTVVLCVNFFLKTKKTYST